jgi:hypothetical protein
MSGRVDLPRAVAALQAVAHIALPSGHQVMVSPYGGRASRAPSADRA